MKLFGKLFKRKRRAEEFEYDSEEEWEQTVLHRENINMHDKEQRDKYVRSCLEQIQDASAEVDQLGQEYGIVTSYLTDMEEIEALPETERDEITDAAKKVSILEDEKNFYKEKPNRMSDQQFRQIESLESEMPDAYEKVKKSEEYQALIRQDLKRLDGERHAYHFRREEMINAMANAKGVATICLSAMVVCFLMLLVLQFTLEMDTQIGYLLTVAMGAIVLTVIYVKYTDAGKELKKVERGINKMILLQNRVKIRYVNNTNLLDYQYFKYGIKSAGQLKQMWDQFLDEREEREQMERAVEDLDFYQKTLLNLLRRYHIKDPRIWLHQSIALIDGKEMIEIRHGYIIRRQKLRKQMDYNQEIAKTAQEEIKNLVSEYPEYAREFLERVTEYERK